MLNQLRQIIPDRFPLRLAYHRLTGHLMALLHGWPGKKLKIIAVTGTNGKTTTANMIYEILKGNGVMVGLVSTTRISDGVEERRNETHKTSLGRGGVHQELRKMMENGCSHAVIEASSQGLDQGRLNGLRINTAVFTNLSPEHIEYHGGLEEYRKCKEKLFAKYPMATVLNFDDVDTLVHLRKHPAGKRYLYGLTHIPQNPREEEEVIVGEEVKISPGCLHFTVEGQTILLEMYGEFNVYNALAALGACRAQGIDNEQVARVLSVIHGVPGRMEEVPTGELGFRVFVDFALTPDALQEVYTTLRRITPGRLIAVLGATGGGRDRWKRPEMGKIAGELCDLVIVTDEEPYDEPPEQIIDEIVAGISGDNYKTVLDRQEAIAEALSEALEGDTVIVTGMGDLTSRMYKGKEIPWIEREVILDVLERREN